MRYSYLTWRNASPEQRLWNFLFTLAITVIENDLSFNTISHLVLSFMLRKHHMQLALPPDYLISKIVSPRK